MAYDGWFRLDGAELINLGRTKALATAFGLPVVWEAEDLTWLGQTASTAGQAATFGSIASAPWYTTTGTPVAGFAGVVPLSVRGLDDDSITADTSPFIVDGGYTHRGRTTPLDIVFNVAFVGRTEAAVDAGVRWFTRALRGGSPGCGGGTLEYFGHRPENPASVSTVTSVRRNNVRLSRGLSITRKRNDATGHVWIGTFTLVAGDPFEYSAPVSPITNLGAATATAPSGSTQGTVASMAETPCPGYDMSPFYDPMYPALLAPPAPPSISPEAWYYSPGATFRRYWVKIPALATPYLNSVPLISISSTEEARMVRVSVWEGSEAAATAICDPLFSAVVGYVPPSATVGTLTLDGEMKRAYMTDATGTQRRAETLVFAPNQGPVEWSSYDSDGGLLVTLDVPLSGATLSGGGNVRVGVSQVGKSD